MYGVMGFDSPVEGQRQDVEITSRVRVRYALLIANTYDT